MENADCLKIVEETMHSLGVRGFSTAWIRGDASTRRYLRVRLEESRAELPECFVAMVLPDAAREYFDLIVQTRQLFDEVGMPVPRFYHADRPRGVALIEDLGDLMLSQALALDAARTGEWYRRAVDLLVDLQVRAAVPEVRNRWLQTPPYQLAFDVEKLTAELRFFRTHFLEGYLGFLISPADNGLLEAEFGMIARMLDGQPRVLTHRDYHSRNLMVQDGGRLRVIDFQDARMGPAQYDLASLLRDSYVTLPDPLRRELLDYYRDRMRERTGKALDAGLFEEVFEWTALQRNVKALGTFGYMVSVAGKAYFEESIRPTLDYLRAARPRFGGSLPVLFSLLERSLPGA